MGDILRELVVGLGLAASGALVMYLVIGDRACRVDFYWLYALGSLVVSVPAIVVLERRRRTRL